MWIERWLILCVKLAYFLICSFENMFAIIFMIHILLVVFYLFSVDNYMFRVDGGDASVQWRVCSELTVKTSVRRKFKSFWCLLLSLWVYFAPCSGVYVVRFEQVNAGWVCNVFADYCIYVCLFKEKYKNWI